MRVYLEVGTRRTFACAVDWPGWCRSGRGTQAALEALADYRDRFSLVPTVADLEPPGEEPFEVVEEVAGNVTTDFGAPGIVPAVDAAALDADAAARMAALVGATWRVLDRVAASAPESLRKGPRGGGRDRDKIVQHVLAAEAAYARKVGVRHRQPALGDDAAIAALRDELFAVLGTSSSGEPVVEKGWPPRYAARRIAWHVLDHAWEIEDRSRP